jgi:hypothetical protein
MVLCSRDLIVSMQHSGKFGVRMSMRFMGDQSVGLQHGGKPILIVSSVSDLREAVEMSCDLTLVPRVKN